MATAAEFQVEEFGRLMAMLDSKNPGEAENALRKMLLNCTRHGMSFADATHTVFIQGYGVALEKELQQQEEEHAGHMTEAAAEIERLRAEVDELRAQPSEAAPEGEHVIDLPRRLRFAWNYPQFRLFVLTLGIGANLWVQYIAAEFGHWHRQLVVVARVVGFVPLCLFLTWSVAQFRRRGLAQMFLKWLVYSSVLLAGVVILNFIGDGKMAEIVAGTLALALVLTLSKLSEWLGKMIRRHVWESRPVRAVRSWF